MSFSTGSWFRKVFQVIGIPPGECSTKNYGCPTEHKEAAEMLAEEARRTGWEWVSISERMEPVY